MLKNPTIVKKQRLLGVLSTDIILVSGVDLDKDYETIKQQLIDNLSDSDTSRIKQMLGQQEIGDRKPSVALRHLLNLAPNSPEIVRIRFREMMPEGVRLILFTLSMVSVEKLAETGDRLMEQMGTGPTTVNAAAAVPPVTNKHSIL